MALITSGLAPTMRLFESGKKHELHLLAGKDVVQGGAISAIPWGDETITEKETD